MWPRREPRRALRAKDAHYIGLDISPVFIDAVRGAGGDGRVWDVRTPEPLPSASHALIQASLYHFIEHGAMDIIERMLAAAEREGADNGPGHSPVPLLNRRRTIGAIGARR